MSRIKTRETVRSIKSLDKAAIASERMKQAAIRAKKNASAFTNDRSCSPEEYAQEKLQYGIEDIAREVTHGAVTGATYTVRRGKELFQKQHEKKQFEKQQAEKEYKTRGQEQESFGENWSESEPGRQQNGKPNQRQRKPSFQRQSPQVRQGLDNQTGFSEEASSPLSRGRKLAIETAKKRNNKNRYAPGVQSVTHDNEIPSKAESPKGRIRVPNRTIKLSPRSSGSITVKTAPQANRPGSDIREIKAVQSASTAPIKTAEAVTESAVDSSIVRARATEKAIKDAQQVQRFRAAAKKAEEGAKKAADSVAASVKAFIQDVKSIVTAISSGGVVAVLAVILVITATAAIFKSPLGILFADEAHEEGSIPLASAISQISAEYMGKLESLQNGNYQSVQIHGKPPKWKDVVAVFATKTAGTDDGVDVLTLDEDRVERMRQVFWDMTKLTTNVETVTYTNQQGRTVSYQILHIYIEAKTADEMRSEYSFTNYQNEALDFLLENLDDLDIPMGDLEISQEDAIAVLSGLPEDLSPDRQAVLEAALSLVGKVTYFWGGKSQTIGWDDRWGTPMEVTSEGSGMTGTVRPFGLDCSGFVDWAFYNATGGEYLPGRGGGAATQHSYCTDIPWSEAQPGDLVFYADDSHVGIVGGYDADGNLLIIHCSGSQNGVAITGSAGFTQAARPDFTFLNSE